MNHFLVYNVCIFSVAILILFQKIVIEAPNHVAYLFCKVLLPRPLESIHKDGDEVIACLFVDMGYFIVYLNIFLMNIYVYF